MTHTPWPTSPITEVACKHHGEIQNPLSKIYQCVLTVLPTTSDAAVIALTGYKTKDISCRVAGVGGKVYVTRRQGQKL